MSSFVARARRPTSSSLLLMLSPVVASSSSSSLATSSCLPVQQRFVCSRCIVDSFTHTASKQQQQSQQQVAAATTQQRSLFRNTQVLLSSSFFRDSSNKRTNPPNKSQNSMSSSAAAASTGPAPEIVQQLQTIVGLDEKNSKDLAKQTDKVKDLLAFFAQHKIATDTAKATKVMMYATWSKPAAKASRDYIAARILDGSLKSTQQTDAAIRFCGSKAAPASADAEYNKTFDKECGVGVTVSSEQIDAEVKAFLKTMEPKSIKANWTKAQSGPFLGLLKKVETLRWADFTVVKTAVETEVPKIVATLPADADSGAADAKKSRDGAAPAAAPAAAVAVTFAPQDDFKKFMLCKERVTVKDVAASKAGASVTIIGWAHKVRHQKSMSFVVLRDSTGFVQIVFEGKVPEFHRETALAITGAVKDEAKAAVDGQPPKEVHVKEYAIVGDSTGEIENIVRPDSGVEVSFDQRHLVVRQRTTANILKVRSYAVQAFRDHFFAKGLFEVAPPTLVQSQAEGGANVFKVGFYEEEAFLTQSSQLYLETCLSSVGDVFCILSSYRAEQQKTHRHLSEFTHIEAEYGLITFEDLLSRLEDLVCDVFDRIIRNCGELVAQLNPEQLHEGATDYKDPASWKMRPTKPFMRLPYHKAIDKCNELGIRNTAEEGDPEFKYGDDITDKPERALVGHFNRPVMMTHFPREMKAFYMEPDAEKPELTESVDILVPGIGEIVGGSMRMYKYDQLMKGYKDNNLDPAPYYWYTDQRKFGSVPHGGFGLGLERYLKWMCNLEAVRDACLFPRYMGRCHP